MADDKIQPIPPMEVTVVGTGTGDGGAPLQSGITLVTPDHQPNIVIQIVTPAAAITIRFINAYITTLIGLVTAGVTTNAIPAADFYHLVLKCAAISVAGPCIGLGKDLITILGKLEGKYPLMTGSV